MASNLIIDVVPRIDSTFKMPTIDPAPVVSIDTCAQPAVSKKTKIMMDIVTFASTYKYHIVVVILCIVIITMLYYLYNKYYNTADECDSVSSICESDSSSKSLAESIKDIDEVINTIINQPIDVSESQSEIDQKIDDILKQTTTTVDADATDIDSKIISILNDNKETDSIHDDINNILKTTIIEDDE